MKLIIFDMDGVIFEHVNFWLELHKKFGTFEEGVELTKKYLKTDYAKLVEEVVGRLWKGKSEAKFMELVNSIEYVNGAKELFKWLKDSGYKIAIISSGSRKLAERAQIELSIDYIYTNELVFKDKMVSGEFNWPIGADRKSVVLRELCDMHNVDYKDCIVVGHDSADIKMAKIAGFTIGFCPKDEEFEKYCNVVIMNKDLVEVRRVIENRII